MTEAIPSREILWNVNSLFTGVVMYSLMTVALIVAAAGVWRRIELWNSGARDGGREVLSIRDAVSRFMALFGNGLAQRKVVREALPAVAHTLVYLGFLVLLFTTTMVFIDHDLGIRIYQGDFYLATTVLSDVFGFGLLLGCAIFAHRRYIARADLVHNRAADGLFLIVLSLLTVQGFALEALRIHATTDPWARYSPVGYLLSKLLWPLSYDATVLFHLVMWWFHTATVFAMLAIFPYSKFFHLLASALNLYFERGARALGAAPSNGDIESLMSSGEEVTFGLGTLKDYSWKSLLDLDACTSCGRCQDACPAYLSGKPLSPKWVILDTRNHMLALAADGKAGATKLPAPLSLVDRGFLKSFFLPLSGLEKNNDGWIYQDGGTFRAGNKAVQTSARVLGGSLDDKIAGTVMDPDTFWSCTTCMACVEACPVGINHVDQIIGNRQHMALMEGAIPHEAQGTLRALENRANPFGAPEDRTKWLQELDVPLLKAGDKVDYLYWVGCVSAFDPRKQKIARALAKIMKEAGLSFGILGTAEGCSGDPARRLGEENLFQTLAKKNIELLRSLTFKVLVANCPHCFNTIKNEYPQFGNLGEGQSPEIIHHSVLLKRLIAEQKITLGENAATYTLHDPCYLGRYNGEYEAPRDSIKAIKGLTILEMDRSREKGMCCGAGGGHFWMDMKKGQRINAIRTDQAAETGATKIATACPFCMQMMEDGVKLTDREGAMEVKDIAEIIAENLVKAEEHSH